MKGIIYIFCIIVVAAAIIVFKKALKSQSNKLFTDDINKFIEKMKCPYCKEYEKPFYKIDENNNESINCCCEKFASILQERISNRITPSGSSQQRTNTANKKQLPQNPKEISDSITTIQQFRSLEKKLDRAEEKLMNHDYKSNTAYDNASKKHDLLQEALSLAESKIYQWQFIPTIDLDTPSIILEHAYKVYSNKEYAEINGSFGDDGNDWYEIDGYGEEEEPESYIKALIKYKKIVESDKSQEEKIKNINQLVSRNKSLAEEFFYADDDLKPGDQIFADMLKDNGLPLAYVLYKEGYTTPKKCLEIDPVEFGKRKGVGPKKVEQLIKFQSTIKSSSK